MLTLPFRHVNGELGPKNRTTSQGVSMERVSQPVEGRHEGQETAAGHDWTPQSLPDCRDGVEERLESCECGARRGRAVRRQNGRVVYGVAAWVGYPDNTGRLP